MKIEPTPGGAIINGYLVDMAQLWHWYNHQVWGSHTPFRALKSLEKHFDLFNDKPEEAAWPAHRISVLYHLATVNNYGYYIPDGVFRLPSGKLRYWRTVGNHVCLGQPVISRDKSYEIGDVDPVPDSGENSTKEADHAQTG